jgi:replicative DNA helicase
VAKKSKFDFDHDFQAELLFLCIRNGTFIRETRGVLSADHFSDPTHRIIAEETLRHFDSRGAPPSRGALQEALKQRLKGKKGSVGLTAVRRELNGLLKAEGVDPHFVAGKVREFAARTEVALLVDAREDYFERGQYRQWHQELTNALGLRHAGPTLVPYDTGLERRYKAYSQGFQKSNPQATGVTSLDTLLIGGLGDGELGVVMGLKGTGKSHCMVQFGAAALARNKAVYHVSLEMNLPSVWRRYDQRLTGMKDKAISKKFRMLAKQMKGTKLWASSYPSNKLKLSELRHTLMVKGAPDLLILDYGAIMAPEERRDAKRFELGVIYAGLRDLGIEFNCPVWTAAQVNRAGYSTTGSEGDYITLENIAESFEIGHHADVVLSWNQTVDELAEKKGRIWVDQNREAPAKRLLHVNADWEISKITTARRR